MLLRMRSGKKKQATITYHPGKPLGDTTLLTSIR